VKFRAHPLAIGIASVQMRKLDALNARRRAYIQAVRDGIRGIPGVVPIVSSEGGESAGFYGFPIRHIPDQMGGMTTEQFRQALGERGVSAGACPYPLLHTLPLFAEGFDIYTRGRGPLCTTEMGGDYPGHQQGDFPVSEAEFPHLIFLKVLSDPVPDAAERVVAAIRDAAASG